MGPRRRDQVGFCSAELLHPGDFLIRHDLSEEFVAFVQRVDAPARTDSTAVATPARLHSPPLRATLPLARPTAPGEACSWPAA
ncbi:MAG: hypothetical protein CFK52_14485 [Chloracidobacterium sp. CP2_5A]|nr:MAG: hypothetical protein CFK52_14485 [Chloracidobacterium sp. CP2_5A]